jgi:hypothetical protein
MGQKPARSLKLRRIGGAGSLGVRYDVPYAGYGVQDRIPRDPTELAAMKLVCKCFADDGQGPAPGVCSQFSAVKLDGSH